MKDLEIPAPSSTETTSLSVEKSLMIVGANGSGKTRFGSKIEQINPLSKRISAQRYLQLDSIVQKQDYDTAFNQLNTSYKNLPPTQPQNDYQQVLVSLFAEESRRNEEAITVVEQGGSLTQSSLVKSVKQQVIEVWNFIFPYRTIELKSDRVMVSDKLSNFSATEMSDGEKVGLYLISQVLLAKPNCLLIIDEPELHLHKALMVRLWNKLEVYRSDCVFVYVTHDLDFAARKPSSKLVWMKSYQNGLWDWEELGPNEVIPENLFLEVLGSRKPVLFTEGEAGSLDIKIYQAYYENFTIIPRGSWKKVVESVKGLKKNKNLHDKEVFGLIDRDFHTAKHIQSLKDDGIFSTCLNKVENLFLLPDVVQLVCNHLSQPEKKEDIISRIKHCYESKKQQISFAASKFAIQDMLNESFGEVKNLEEYQKFKDDLIKNMDGRLSLRDLPKSDDVAEILKTYPYKGLVKEVQGLVGLSNNGLQDLVLSFLTSNKRADLLAAWKDYLPSIPIVRS